jgi:Leucine-rich repeat (LRR) protein
LKHLRGLDLGQNDISKVKFDKELPLIYLAIDGNHLQGVDGIEKLTLLQELCTHFVVVYRRV